MKTGEIQKEVRELKKGFVLIMWCVKYLHKINNYLNNYTSDSIFLKIPS